MSPVDQIWVAFFTSRVFFSRDPFYENKGMKMAEKFGKINVNLAKISQRKCLIGGQYMDPILGQ